MLRQFSENHPRVYGVLMAVPGLALAVWAVRLAEATDNDPVPAIALLTFATLICIAAMMYIVGGALAAAFDRRFVQAFDVNKVSLRQVAPILCLCVLSASLSVWIVHAIRLNKNTSGEQSARPYGSPAAGSPSGQP